MQTVAVSGSYECKVAEDRDNTTTGGGFVTAVPGSTERHIAVVFSPNDVFRWGLIS